MALAGALGSELGLRLLLSPAGTNVLVRTACVGIGVGFPVYSTFKAVESKDPEEQDRWLVYWTAYGCFSIAESFSDKLLAWCPFYHHVKFAFLLWLQFPHNHGARHVYNSILKPLFIRHQSTLDRVVNTTRNDIDKLASATQESKEFQAVVRTTRSLASSAYESIVRSASNPSRNPSSPPEDWVDVATSIYDESEQHQS